MIRFSHLSCVALLLSACGQAPSPSSTQQRQEVEPRHVTQEAAEAYVAHFDGLLDSSTRTGTIAIEAFLSVMPMLDDQRAIILRAFTRPFDVNCDAAGLCAARTSGRPVEATMDITISGISEPKLRLDREVVTGMIRRSDGIEFCNVEGMWAKKFFVTKAVQGIYLAVDPARRSRGLVVNVGSDSDNYTCE